jgi:hypothetical protein
MNVRCPICQGTGGVEPRFGSGSVLMPTTSSAFTSKKCPGCGGTGMQEVCNYPYQTDTYESNKWTATTRCDGGE